MSTWLMVLLASLGVLLVVMVFVVMARRGKPFRRLLASTFQGIAAIAAVNMTAAYTGVSLGFSWLSLGGCLLLGAPGVVTMLLLNVIFGIK